MDIKYIGAWAIYASLVVFLSFILELIFGLPVTIILIFMGFSVKFVELFTKYAAIATSVYISFFFFKWSIKTFIMPQVSPSSIENAKNT